MGVTQKFKVVTNDLDYPMSVTTEDDTLHKAVVFALYPDKTGGCGRTDYLYQCIGEFSCGVADAYAIMLKYLRMKRKEGAAIDLDVIRFLVDVVNLGDFFTYTWSQR